MAFIEQHFSDKSGLSGLFNLKTSDVTLKSFPENQYIMGAENTNSGTNKINQILKH